MQTAPAARAAVTRALPLLQKSAGEFAAQRACVSCHHNSLAMLALRLARQHGFSIDSKVLASVETRTLRELRNPNALDDAVQATGVADPTPNESYLLMAAHAAGVERGLTTGVYARRIARWQRDGHWITSDFRPPHSSSLFTATATAVRAMQFYMPEELSAERDAVFGRARRWLTATRPQSTEDAAFRLMGLAWAGATADERDGAARDLRALQRSDGGWSQLPGYDSDAYSTGEALVALHEAGVPASDASPQKGLRFLVSSQAKDGTWRVRTRMVSPAEVSPPYFQTGFPYGKDEFISYAGSCWAVMALLSALPDAAAPRDGPRPGAAPAVQPWVRTALFGSASELGARLSTGLDPNSRTERGTTLLMMAAPDVDKVRLLLSRGANAKARAGSGSDALTVATAHYGTSPSVRLLLDAGAETDAPEGVRVRRSPLTFASMSGDLETVNLLLARKADASVEALSEAVTFGHAEVTQRLVDAGVSVRLTERTGITLLHWATITNRPTLIPVLVKAGVPVDATDDNGYTALMYAATVDVGDTATLEALLRAGANRTVRNLDGRTPLEQARRFRHTRLADALK